LKQRNVRRRKIDLVVIVSIVKNVKTLITLVVRPQFVNRHRSLCLKLRMMSTLCIRVEVAYTN
jgi:hypothetical protein